MNSIQPQNPFDTIRRAQVDGSEYWSARELAPLLGYDTWRRFADSLERAQYSCECAGLDSADHFVSAVKMIETGKGATREVLDYRLTRYACYLTAMNGDPRKKEIADAQLYFAVKTRQAETAPVIPAASPLALSRLMLESLEQQDARVTALEQWRDHSPITSEKVGSIHRLGQQLGQLIGNYGRAWRLFNDHFGIASYRDLPTYRFEEGVRFLRLQIAAYTGKPLLEVDV